MHARILAGTALAILFASAPADAAEIGPADDVKAAINALKPGEELVLRGGTYTLTSRLGVSVKGTKPQPIVVRAKANEHPILYRADASQNIVDLDDVEFLTFRGIEWKGGSQGIRIIKARDLTIEDCEVHDTDDVAIAANASGAAYQALRILRNEIHHTSGTGEALYLGCNSNACRIFESVIAGNHIHHTNGPNVQQGDGIEIKEGSYGNVVQDNVIHDTKYPCILTYSVVGNGLPNIIERNVMWGCGDHAIQSAADALIQNNIILSAASNGIAMQPHQAGTPSNLVVVHNTILKANNKAISASGITGSVVIANNAVYAQAGSAISVSGALGSVVVLGNVGVGDLSGVSGALATGNLGNDFVSASYAGAPPMDVFPKAGSALIGTGDAARVVLEDFDRRPRNGVADVGAYAYAAGPPGWTITAGFKTTTTPGGDAGAGSGLTDGGTPTGSEPGAPDGGNASSGAPPSSASRDGGDASDGCQCATGIVVPTTIALPPALLVVLGALAVGRRRTRR